jgi:uncharacterized protein (DUF697 family)
MTKKVELNSEEKEKELSSTVNNHIVLSMGAGLIPVPLVDIGSITAVQIDLINRLCEIYGVKFSENRGKSILSSLLGGVTSGVIARGIFGSFMKSIPVIGTVTGGLSLSVTAGASTYAIAKVFIQHFESGGDFLSFDVSKARGYFSEQFEKGKEIVPGLKKKKDTEEKEQKEAVPA